ncbi:hypothetical protein K0M31_010467 [Melipona bicolor]|uniref:Uncharacterized protein n=1 Tax=Melipona bicolor TaxID=60889 RepID=A0AA40KI33_9HYME|nr:hypothetical protein K0M31_010467 [Melipona bicolor]
MTLTDQATKAKGPPRWLEPDQVLPVQGRVGEDVVVEPKLRWSDVFDELRFELENDRVDYEWISDLVRVSRGPAGVALPEAVGRMMSSVIIGADEVKSSNRRVRVVRRERTPGGFIFARLSPSKREQYHVDDK